MTTRLLICILLAGLVTSAHSTQANTASRPSDPFQQIQYQFSYGENTTEDKNALPEKLIYAGIMPAIDFGFTYTYNQIDGENLFTRWQGKVTLDKEEVRLIQTDDSNNITVLIDGETIKLNAPLTLTKGEHTIDVRYTPRWHADKFVLNFLPQSEIIKNTDIRTWRETLNIERSDVIAFVVSTYRLNNHQPQLLTLPKSNNPLILVLDNEELSNWHIENPHNTPIKALILLRHSGVVTGSNAPIYRFPALTFYSDVITDNCDCTGGTHFSCGGSGERGALPIIKTISQQLFKREPHIIARQAFNGTTAQLDWQSLQTWQKLYDKRLREVLKAKAQCGGETAFSFDNAFVKTEQPISWATQLGIKDIPNNAFRALYFSQENPHEIVFHETVPNVSINYVSDQFHHLDSEKFMGLWVGKKTFDQDTPMSLQFDFSWAQLRIWVDGNIIFSQRHGENGTPQKQTFDYTFTKGEHTIEVEYINHWHTTGFTLNFIPQQPIETSSDIAEKIQQAEYAVVKATVYESENLDNHLNIQIPNTSKPAALLLSSHNKVFWKVQSNPNLAMIVIQDETGEVQVDSHIPIIRVKTLPTIPTEKQFYIYGTKDNITGEMFK